MHSSHHIALSPDNTSCASISCPSSEFWYPLRNPKNILFSELSYLRFETYTGVLKCTWISFMCLYQVQSRSVSPDTY